MQHFMLDHFSIQPGTHQYDIPIALCFGIQECLRVKLGYLEGRFEHLVALVSAIVPIDCVP